MSDRIQNNNFAYSTQETQSISELHKQLNEILRELINQEFINKETGLKATIKQDDIDKISSRKAIVKSNDNGFTKEEHFEVAKDIAPLYENAVLKATHLVSKERPNVVNVHRFTIDVEVNGKDTTAKITVFEKIKGDNRIYTIELQGLNPLPYSSRMQEAEVAKSLSQDGTLAYTSDPNIANFDNESIAQNKSKNQIKPKCKMNESKELRGIYNVTFNDKTATSIKTDLEIIEDAIINHIIYYVKGWHNERRDKGIGAEHIKLHLEKGSNGEITIEELLNLGNSIRKYLKEFKDPFIDIEGLKTAKIYEWQDKAGIRFRAVVDKFKGEGLPKTPLSPFDSVIISFYSDRNLNERMKFKNPQVESYYENDSNSKELTLKKQIKPKSKVSKQKSKSNNFERGM